MKNKTLRELKKKFAALICESEYCRCKKCSNKELCDELYRKIKSMEE